MIANAYTMHKGVQVAQLTLQHLLEVTSQQLLIASHAGASSKQHHCQHHQQQQHLQAGTHPKRQELTICQNVSLTAMQHKQLWPSQQSTLLKQQQQHRSVASLAHRVRSCQQQQLALSRQEQQQLQLLRGYHPATHTARTLTSKLLKQRSWQDLRLLFDASGSGRRLNPIHLCTLLQQLSRLVPAPELLTAAERNHIRGFADELLAVCTARLHRFDAVGLSSIISSAVKLGCTPPAPQQYQQHTQHQQPATAQAQQQLGMRSAASTAAVGLPAAEAAAGVALFTVQLLAAAAKQVTYANGHSAGVLLSALTGLQQHVLQQQQQQQQQQYWWQQGLLLQGLQQQLVAWQGFTAALLQRLQACVAVQQLSRADASKLCLTASRLAGVLAQQRAAAAEAAATALTQQQQQQQQRSTTNTAVASGGAADSSIEVLQDDEHVGLLATATATATSAAATSPSVPGAAITPQQLQLQYNQLQQQLRALMALSAQHVFTPTAPPTTPAADGMSDASRVLYALAKTWAWPGWPALLGLARQYSTAVQGVVGVRAAEPSQARGKRSKGPRQGAALGPSLGTILLGFSKAGGQSLNPGAADNDAAAEVEAVIRESLPATLWAVGRLTAQQQRQQHKQQRQGSKTQVADAAEELQQHLLLWDCLLPLLPVCQQQLHQWYGPLQLVQAASGLGSLVQSSRALLQQASATPAAGTTAGQPFPADCLGSAEQQQTQPSALQSQASPTTADGQRCGRAARAGQAATAALLAGEQQDAVAAGLQGVLGRHELHEVLRQHVLRVESLLPLLTAQHRLQLAAAYQQLGVVLPTTVSSVFQRDLAQQQQQQLREF